MKFYESENKWERTFNDCMGEYKKLLPDNISERLIQLNERVPNFKPIDFKPEQSVQVGVGECAFITADTEERRILGSMGAGCCFILAIADPRNKCAWLAHIDALVSMPQLKEVLAKVFTKIDRHSAVAHVVGGNDSSIVQGIAICNELEKQGVTINSALLRLHMELDQLSLAVDPQTGTIYAPESNNLAERRDLYRNLSMRITKGNELGSIGLTEMSPHSIESIISHAQDTMDKRI
ncbi:hypothetical protein [Legionella waltersii]|uniref:Uncharacterized protein n=1 Tax=Legionella waltersii TaxID=66969 RepID=A0A0W1AK76_9GAMM|nr:hypothetical protein [Legionella waltersii]KTD81755.1 hypothetical protein Lwal_1007 [Legionella waltersii]SNU97104.1 Uncharacterised protein [Legionella waltersii]